MGGGRKQGDLTRMMAHGGGAFGQEKTPVIFVKGGKHRRVAQWRIGREAGIGVEIRTRRGLDREGRL